MQGVEDCACGVFVHAAALHAHIAVFDYVAPSHTVAAAYFCKLADEFVGGEALAVQGHGVTLLEIDRDDFGLIGSFFHWHAAFVADRIGSKARIFEL